MSDAVPIHPLRLCREVAAFVDRSAILVIDWQEILKCARQSIRSYCPAHRRNSEPFCTMGVVLPFGFGTRAARPDAQVVVLHGDGSFALNAMELDTAVRHKLPVLVVVSLNGGWTADPDRSKEGRELGYTRFERMAERLGCHGEFVERPEDIRPALESGKAAVSCGQVAVVNVVTDWATRAVTANFTNYATCGVSPGRPRSTRHSPGVGAARVLGFGHGAPGQRAPAPSNRIVAAWRAISSGVIAPGMYHSIDQFSMPRT